MPSLQVAVISNRPHSPSFSASLALLMANVTRSTEFSTLVLFMQQNISQICQGRDSAIQMAQEKSVSHLLFVDDDMIFPEDAAVGLLSRNKRIVGANYVRKQFPISFVAKDLDGKPINSNGKSGIQSASLIGFGCILFDMDVFTKYPAPYFALDWTLDAGYATEDTVFCRAALKRGEEIFIDHDLSNLIGHAGEFIFRGIFAEPETNPGT